MINQLVTDESKTGSDTGSDSSSEDLRLTPPTSSPPRASVTTPFKKRRHNLDNATSPNETEDTTATINNADNNYSYQAGHFPYMFPTTMYSTPERPFLQLPMPGGYKCFPAATNPNVISNDSSSDSEKSADEGKRGRDTILIRPIL